MSQIPVSDYGHTEVERPLRPTRPGNPNEMVTQLGMMSPWRGQSNSIDAGRAVRCGSLHRIGKLNKIAAMAIKGLRRYTPEPQVDHRGSLTVMHVASGTGSVLRQLNVVRSKAGTLRGMHAHSRYTEHYVPVAGRMFFVLKDARRSERSFGEELSFWVDSGDEVGIEVPAGVAHGVYFAEPGVLVYGLSTAWTGANEYGCRWNDSAITSSWPTQAPTLSERDSVAGSFDELVTALDADLRTYSV